MTWEYVVGGIGYGLAILVCKVFRDEKHKAYKTIKNIQHDIITLAPYIEEPKDQEQCGKLLLEIEEHLRDRYGEKNLDIY